MRMEKKQDYDSVADLYADVFSDIRVRGVETDWLISRLPDGEFALLEIGCGSGSASRTRKTRSWNSNTFQDRFCLPRAAGYSIWPSVCFPGDM